MEITKPIQLSKSVYCLVGHTNIGIIEDEKNIILIDSGLNRENATRIDKIIQDNFNKKIGTIINTHSNADHAGGNKYFFEKYNCKILSTKKESAFLENPYLESAILWGAHPFDKIRTSYFEWLLSADLGGHLVNGEYGFLAAKEKPYAEADFSCAFFIFL